MIQIYITRKDSILCCARVDNDEPVAFLAMGPGIPVSIIGNTYQGIVRRMTPPLKGAFIDIGIGTEAFLPFKPKDPPLHEGMNIRVQVTHDRDGIKGPRVKLLPDHAPLVQLDPLARFIEGADEVIVDHPSAVLKAKEIEAHPPIHLKHGSSCFDHDLEEAWSSLFQPVVPLLSGGNIVIEETEALWVIDVNTSSADTATRSTQEQVNLEAAAIIPKILKLREISGIIVIDFAGKKEDIIRQDLVARLKDSSANDHRISVHGATRIGLVEATRQQAGINWLKYVPKGAR